MDQTQDIQLLNERYASLTPEERLRQLYLDFEPGGIMCTSSFGTTSALLLHLVSRVRPQQKIHFIDTRYLFRQTRRYRDQLVEQLGLDVEDTFADEAGYKYTLKEQLWQSEPDVCCGINKTMPVEALREQHQVWVSGLIGHQNDFRKGLNVFEFKGGILRFHPIVDLSPEEVQGYFAEHHLPRHPLEAAGFGSVGCIHCTVQGKGRAGRWMGSIKTECGLHTS